MIIRLSTVHEEVQVIPLLPKEGLEVLDPDSRAGALRRLEISARERRLKSRMQSVKEGVRMRKNVK